ncbi:hypothetical protein JDBV08_00565 [Mycobacterium phage jiawei]|nr:hypothetical protein JDBV08_00565 [Mycobacterium phage jiawei]
MCTVRTKTVAVKKDDDAKEVPVLRNPLLDGVDATIRARSTGTRALRIDRPGGGATINRPTTPTAPGRPVSPEQQAEIEKWTTFSKLPGAIGRVGQLKLKSLQTQ